VSPEDARYWFKAASLQQTQAGEAHTRWSREAGGQLQDLQTNETCAERIGMDCIKKAYYLRFLVFDVFMLVFAQLGESRCGISRCAAWYLAETPSGQN
jgi:hypothetical protein